MLCLVSPPRDQLDKLRPPLTTGERLVFEFLDVHLHEDWEIYVRPHLNGLRPDFVLLHPKAGIAIFEVKDWNLDAMHYWVKPIAGKAPRLMGTRDGKNFSLQSDNPVEKVFRYKQEVHDLYCPRLNRQAGFAVITSGVIFPFADDTRVEKLLRPCREYRGMLGYEKYYPISGRVAMQSGNLRAVFPEGVRLGSNYMNPELAKDLRNWLIEPDFAATQRTPLELDENQKRYVTTKSATGYRRIKGPAGSGKSVVLAARAAQLTSEGKEVLVVTFNITLLHYLRDMAVRWPHPHATTRNSITWLNFHHWCKRICQEMDREDEYTSLWRNHFSSEEDLLSAVFDAGGGGRALLTREIPQFVGSIIDTDSEGLVQRYDAILVDEGQDFLPEWWNVLRKVCKKDGEMLLVADATQDIYGTARSWTDRAMRGAGFTGRWAELPISYRLPPTLIYLYLCRN